MAANKLYISMYHYVRDLSHSRYPEIRGLATELFRQQLSFFRDNFNVVRMEDVLESLDTGRALPDRAMLLTFDDGYIDHYLTVLPILRSFGMQGSFFIPGRTFTEHALLDVNKVHFVLASAGDPAGLTEEIRRMYPEYRGEGEPSFEELYDRYAVASRFDDKDTIFCKRVLQTGLPEAVRNSMTSRLFERYVGIDEESFARELYMEPGQMKLMRDEGMFFGLHGYDHYWLGNLDRASMEADIDRALEVMEPFINKTAWVMNYPYGSYNAETIEAIRKRGCVLGLTTRVDAAVWDDGNRAEARFILPRFDCNDFPPKSERYKA